MNLKKLLEYSWRNFLEVMTYKDSDSGKDGKSFAVKQ